VQTYNFEHGAPPSLPMAHNRRLPDVTLAIVPFTKHIERAQLMMTPAVRLLVACMISSISGWPVRVVKIVSGFGMQKRRTMIIDRPLRAVSLTWTYVSCNGRCTLHPRWQHTSSSQWVRLELVAASLLSYG
jgi:hypothetical protein